MERGSGDGSRVKCSLCRHWRPHVFYPYLGFCAIHSTLTFEDYSCPRFERLTYVEDRFYWCLTCRTRLTREEALDHSSRGHRVYLAGYIDPDVREEIYDAF